VLHIGLDGISLNFFRTSLTSKQLQNQDELQQKIAILEKQLQWEKMRVFALDTMIDIAEKQLDISIRKSLAVNSQRSKKANPITR
jgi:hypothetical protein